MISSCKLFYIEWTNSKVLLYSIGSYIQNPMMNYNGKEYEKQYVCIYIYIYIYVCVCVCVCMTESLCGIAEINTTFLNQIYLNKINFKKKEIEVQASFT